MATLRLALLLIGPAATAVRACNCSIWMIEIKTQTPERTRLPSWGPPRRTRESPDQIPGCPLPTVHSLPCLAALTVSRFKVSSFRVSSSGFVLPTCRPSDLRCPAALLPCCPAAPSCRGNEPWCCGCTSLRVFCLGSDSLD